MTAEPGVPAVLVYLDVDDEITSAAARIRASDAERVTLVLPYGSRLATSRINFRLLAREAADRHKQLEIITADASARALAAAAGLPVHPSVAAFEGAASGASNGTQPAVGAATHATSAAAAATDLWAGGARQAATAPAAAGVPVGGRDIDDSPTRAVEVPRRKRQDVPLVGPPRPPVRTGLAIGIGLAAVVLVIVGAMLALQLLPSATIVLAPRAEPIPSMSLTVEARTDVLAVDAANLLVPAQRIEFDLNAAATITATGTKVTETKASGAVTFSNFDTGSGVFIPAGTIVRTKGKGKVQFATAADLSLPAAQIDFFPPFPTRPSTGSVDIEAVEAGEDGNVGNNTITEVQGGGRNLFVTNPEETTGGERSEAPEISEEDVATAVATLGDQLQADLDAQIAAGTGVPAGVTTFPDTITIGPPEYSDDPATLVGSPELSVELTATSAGSILGVDPAPIQDIARSRLQAEVIDGWSLDPDSIDLTMSIPSAVGDVATYPFTIAGTQVHDVDEDALIDAIRGKVLAEARTTLEAYGDVEVTLWPDWVTTIPENADRITLTLGEPAFEPSPSP